MERPVKLAQAVIDSFVTSHEGWKLQSDGLEKSYTFQYYGGAVAFAVHVAFAAEKRDHHPDMHLSWGKVLVRWTTHDAGGVTALDIEMAELADNAYRR